MPGAKMGPLLFQDFLAVELIYLIQNIWILSDGFDFEPCSTYLMYSIEAIVIYYVLIINNLLILINFIIS